MIIALIIVLGNNNKYDRNGICDPYIQKCFCNEGFI